MSKDIAKKLLGAVPVIGPVASAVVGLVGAHNASNAAKQAAAVQVASGDKALALEKEQWQQQQARSQPYVDAGTSALGNLNRLIGGGSSPQGGLLNPYARTFNPALPGGGSLGPAPSAPPGASGMPPASGAMPPSGALRPSPDASQGQLVTLRAPDGTQKAVPSSQVAYFLSKGAQRVM